MAVEVKTTMSLQPWSTPNFARVSTPPSFKEEGFKELPTVAVGDLAPEVLDALAQAWLDELYSKVSRPNPFHNTITR